VVGSAIGTAGAIATAALRNDAQAYNSGYYGQRYYGGYNGGFACVPGTTFRGEDGLRHICQGSQPSGAIERHFDPACGSNRSS
jgi:hypothetical protein